MNNKDLSAKLDLLLNSQEMVLKLNQRISEQLDTITAQNKKIAEQAQTITEQTQTIADQTQTIADQKETIAGLKKMIFGIKSEKSKTLNIPGQLSFFPETDPDTVVDVKTKVTSYTRSSNKKKKATHDELYKNLPSEKRIIYVSDNDKICGFCGSEMVHLGEKFIRDEIEIIPAKVKHIEIYQETVICEHCQKNDAPVIVGAAIPSPLIPHSPATASTVAYAMHQKYVNAVPLYRQEKEWLRMGVKIPRATLSNWVITCAEKYLQPVYDKLYSYEMERDILCADETPCQVLREKDKTPQSKSYMWLYCTANDGEPPIALYDYQSSRQGFHARNFLKKFKGHYLVCDGYQGYNNLPDGILRCACLAHVRRKWFEAISTARRKNSQHEKLTPAEIGFEFCNRLFEQERKMHETSDPKIRKEIREKIEPEIWSEFWKWLNTLHVTATNKLGKAVNYTQNQKPYLENYLKDERIPISNNFAENSARPYAVGRKNFLFHNSTDGAHTSAVIYSLVETAKRNGLDTLKYLTEVMVAMKDYKNEPAFIDDLMPWSDTMKKTCQLNQTI